MSPCSAATTPWPINCPLCFASGPNDPAKPTELARCRQRPERRLPQPSRGLAHACNSTSPLSSDAQRALPTWTAAVASTRSCSSTAQLNSLAAQRHCLEQCSARSHAAVASSSSSARLGAAVSSPHFAKEMRSSSREAEAEAASAALSVIATACPSSQPILHRRCRLTRLPCTFPACTATTSPTPRARTAQQRHCGHPAHVPRVVNRRPLRCPPSPCR